MPDLDDELEDDFDEIRRLIAESLLPPSRQSMTSSVIPNVGPPVGSQTIPFGTLHGRNAYGFRLDDENQFDGDEEGNLSDEEYERAARRIAALPSSWPRQSMAGVLDYVSANPGKTAADIANALGLKMASVSSHLYKLFQQTQVIRLPNKGKRGGFGYYTMTPELRKAIESGVKDEPVAPTEPPRTAWEHLLDD